MGSLRRHVQGLPGAKKRRALVLSGIGMVAEARFLLGGAYIDLMPAIEFNSDEVLAEVERQDAESDG